MRPNHTTAVLPLKDGRQVELEIPQWMTRNEYQKLKRWASLMVELWQDVPEFNIEEVINMEDLP